MRHASAPLRRQSFVITNAAASIADVDPAPARQREHARACNAALIAGACLEAGGDVSVGSANANGVTLEYEPMLVAADDGLMARTNISSISVDLPVFHGTSAHTLLRGVPGRLCVGARWFRGSHLRRRRRDGWCDDQITAASAGVEHDGLPEPGR